MQVTSRGCSRAYIVCVLWRAWEYVRLLKSNDSSIAFPFADSVVVAWLTAARSDCTQATEEFLLMFGGTEFTDDDPTSYWTISSHFFTWWKNNIERKSKFAHLIGDAGWQGSSGLKHALRSKYCRQILALALNIKNHFDRIVNQQPNRPICQLHLPFPMPNHMVHATYSTVYQYIDVDAYLNDRVPKPREVEISSSRPKRKVKRPRYDSSSSDEEEEYHPSLTSSSSSTTPVSSDSETETPESLGKGKRPSRLRTRLKEESFSNGPKIKKRKYEYLLQKKSSPAHNSSSPRLTSFLESSGQSSRKSNMTTISYPKRKRGRPAKKRSPRSEAKLTIETSAVSPSQHSFNHHHYHTGN